MDCRADGSSCDYLIDNSDRIVKVSAAWLKFARENGAEESCHPDRVLNRSIWEFIEGFETSLLYEIVLKKVRKTCRSVRLPFRCDAPSKRRFLELLITPVQDDYIEFASTLLREELRDCVDLLEPGISRSGTIIKMCSMCKKVELPGNLWVEVEDAIATLRLFDTGVLPPISHGLCRNCYKFVMAEVDAL
jgi:hypothetical protein